MRHCCNSTVLALSLFLAVIGCESKGNPNQKGETGQTGALSVLASNPRYFTADGSTPVYLAAAHTWLNLQDGGTSEPLQAFNYTQYLNFLRDHHYNFIRLWVWEEARWTSETPGDYFFSPMPYQRTGPGEALDGKPKFDLTKFNDAYFSRLRERVVAARALGIYVSVMLFNGWSIQDKLGDSLNNPWEGHPFNKTNNINGIDGDPGGNGNGEEVHTLEVPAIFNLQKAYVRRVIDELADLDNVLYEISNESHSLSVSWQYQLINYIHTYEMGNARRHPVGMTAIWPNGDNADLFDGPADWISPNGSVTSRPPAAGKKVILADTDHLCGICTDHLFPWRSFLAAENPLFMDPYDRANASIGTSILAMFNNPDDSSWLRIRNNIGYTRCLAGAVNLVELTPHPELASSGNCLAWKGHDYIALAEPGNTVSVNLTGDQASFSVMWLDPLTGNAMWVSSVKGGRQVTVTAPFPGSGVVWLHAGTADSTPDCFR